MEVLSKKKNIQKDNEIEGFMKNISANNHLSFNRKELRLNELYKEDK